MSLHEGHRVGVRSAVTFQPRVQGFGGPCCARILTTWFATKERGTYWGMWNIAHNLGGFLAPIVAGTAARMYGWKYGARAQDQCDMQQSSSRALELHATVRANLPQPMLAPETTNCSELLLCLRSRPRPSKRFAQREPAILYFSHCESAVRE